MRQRTFKSLLVALLVASGLLYAGGDAHAVTFSYNVNLVSVSNVSPASANYTYSFSQIPGSSALSYIDFEIPSEILLPAGPFSAAGNANLVASSNGTGLSGEVYDVGVGDYGTKFGVGDTRYRVVKVNIPNPASTFSVGLLIKNQSLGNRTLAVSPGEILIKAGNGTVTQSFTLDAPAVMNAPVDALAFSVSPSSIRVGECPTLNWTTSNAAYVFVTNINFNGGLMTPLDQGSLLLSGDDCPVLDTKYILTAIGFNGSRESVEATVLVGSPPLVPTTPVQNLTIPDVPGGVTFNILRNPRSGQITDVQVCGDPDFCGGECCSLEVRSDFGGEKIHNCTNLNGNQGLQECIIAGSGSPHTQNIVSGTITKVYPYCRSGETKLPATTNSFGFDCLNALGQIHAD